MEKVYSYIFMMIMGSLWNEALGQDVHFTDYRNISNFFNSAMTGDFLGTVKVQTTIRTQYERTYESGLIGGQLNLPSPFQKNHWVGIGANAIFDQAGDLRLRATGGEIHTAYHIPLGKKGAHIISVGGGLAGYGLSVNTDQYKSETVLSRQVDPDLQRLTDFNPTLLSFQVGMYLRSKINSTDRVRSGIASTYINNPQYNILTTAQPAAFGRRTNIFISYEKYIDPRWSVEPALYVSFSEYQSNINIQCIGQWVFNPAKTYRLQLGLTHRLEESWGVIVGMGNERYRMTASIDILSGVSSELLQPLGAIELGGFYIFRRYTRPTLNPIIFCPRL